MKALIASLAALGLIAAGPAVAQTASTTTKTVTKTPAGTKTMTKTTMHSHHMRHHARHHAMCGCPVRHVHHAHVVKKTTMVKKIG